MSAALQGSPGSGRPGLESRTAARITEKTFRTGKPVVTENANREERNEAAK